MSEYEERRTTPDSLEVAIWGRRREDRFLPWMSASHEAILFGWPLEKCGDNVSPDGSVLIKQEPLDGFWDATLDPLVEELTKKLSDTIDSILKDEENSRCLMPQ
jgi:hypothetical protein